MTKYFRLLMAMTLIASLSTLITSCGVGMPFRWPGYDAVKGVTVPNAGNDVLLVITNPKVDRTKRAAFDDYTQRLLKSMHNTPGLIGYSGRKQIFGDEAWTASVWADEDSMRRFIFSPGHLAAMDAGKPALKDVRFRREWIPAKNLPLTWTDVLAILDDGKTPPAAKYQVLPSSKSEGAQ
jgi:quinol monooxygenase YgiN